MCVVGRSRDGDRASTPRVQVTHRIRQCLQQVHRKVTVIPEYVIMRWSAGALNTLIIIQQ